MYSHANLFLLFEDIWFKIWTQWEREWEIDGDWEREKLKLIRCRKESLDKEGEIGNLMKQTKKQPKNKELFWNRLRERKIPN